MFLTFIANIKFDERNKTINRPTLNSTRRSNTKKAVVVSAKHAPLLYSPHWREIFIVILSLFAGTRRCIRSRSGNDAWSVKYSNISVPGEWNAPASLGFMWNFLTFLRCLVRAANIAVPTLWPLIIRVIPLERVLSLGGFRRDALQFYERTPIAGLFFYSARHATGRKLFRVLITTTKRFPPLIRVPFFCHVVNL